VRRADVTAVVMGFKSKKRRSAPDVALCATLHSPVPLPSTHTFKLEDELLFLVKSFFCANDSLRSALTVLFLKSVCFFCTYSLIVALRLTHSMADFQILKKRESALHSLKLQL